MTTTLRIAGHECVGMDVDEAAKVERVLAWDTERLTNVVDGQPNTFYTRRIRIEGQPGWSTLELVLFAGDPDALEITHALTGKHNE